VWTLDRVRALGLTTTLTTAAAILGISRSQAYRLAATGTFPVPLIRAGIRRRWGQQLWRPVFEGVTGGPDR
jgi:hypothetical protein